jgi:hypothetical protein
MEYVIKNGTAYFGGPLVFSKNATFLSVKEMAKEKTSARVFKTLEDANEVLSQLQRRDAYVCKQSV